MKYDMRVNFYYSILDAVLTNLSTRFDGRSAVIMKGLASLHLGVGHCLSDYSVGDLEAFADFYKLNVSECVRQRDLANSNALLVATKR